VVAKNYKIIFRKNVLSDLKEIVDYIKIDSPSNAKKVKLKILSKIQTLKIFPYKHHIDYFHPLSANSDKYRLVSVWSYNIHYQIEDNTVFILKIIYGGKNPTTITKEINKQ
jgi:plasmid stabilization system protein ParE